MATQETRLADSRNIENLQRCLLLKGLAGLGAPPSTINLPRRKPPSRLLVISPDCGTLSEHGGYAMQARCPHCGGLLELDEPDYRSRPIRQKASTSTIAVWVILVGITLVAAATACVMLVDERRAQRSEQIMEKAQETIGKAFQSKP